MASLDHRCWISLDPVFGAPKGSKGSKGPKGRGFQVGRALPDIPHHNIKHGLFWGLTWGQGVGGTDRGLGNTT